MITEWGTMFSDKIVFLVRSSVFTYLGWVSNNMFYDPKLSFEIK